MAFCLVELLLVSIFFKPVFSRKPKYIIRDILLLAAAAVITDLCLFLWGLHGGMYGSAGVSVLFAGIVSTVHFVLFRVLRPVKIQA